MKRLIKLTLMEQKPQYDDRYVATGVICLSASSITAVMSATHEYHSNRPTQEITRIVASGRDYVVREEFANVVSQWMEANNDEADDE